MTTSVTPASPLLLLLLATILLAAAALPSYPSAALFGAVSLVSAAGACTDDFDCSLAGSCVNGKCECQAWTKGDDCAALNLAPLSSADAVRPIVEPTSPPGNWTRWGGSVVHDADGDGMYHMFAAEMAEGCTLGVWTFKSQVMHATSSSATGPFTRVGVAIPSEAHNPVLTRDPSDGTWLIWTCGCPYTPQHAAGCARETVTCPGGAPPQWTTTVYSSASLSGPWEAHPDILGNITRAWSTASIGSQNVSPVFDATSKSGALTLMFKGPDNNTEASIATAPSWRGPYTLRHVNVFARYFAQNITNEDCYLWQSPADGFWHALSHRMSPADRGTFVSGGHAFAKDLDDWRYALTPAYTDQVALSGGGTYNLQRRERPQLLFGSDGLPAVLFNGVTKSTGGGGTGYDGNCFTFPQKLGTAAAAAPPANAPSASAASVVGFSCDDANCTGPPSSPSNVIGPLPADVCCTIHDPDGNPPFGAMVRLARHYPRTTCSVRVPEQ